MKLRLSNEIDTAYEFDAICGNDLKIKCLKIIIPKIDSRTMFFAIKKRNQILAHVKKRRLDEHEFIKKLTEKNLSDDEMSKRLINWHTNWDGRESAAHSLVDRLFRPKKLSLQVYHEYHKIWTTPYNSCHPIFINKNMDFVNLFNGCLIAYQCGNKLRDFIFQLNQSNFYKTEPHLKIVNGLENGS